MRKYNYFSKHERMVKAIMRSAGLSKNQTRCLAGYLALLERNNGVYFVVNVLKERTMALLHAKAEEYETRGGFWTGPFRPVHAMSVRGPKGLERALNVLKLHGLFKAPAASRTTYKVLATELGRPKDVFGQFGLPRLETFTDHSRGIKIQHDGYYPNSIKRCPIGKASVPEYLMIPKDHIESMDYFPSHVVLHYNYYKALVGKDMPSLDHFEQLKLIQNLKGRVRYRLCRQFGVVGLLSDDCAGSVSVLVKDGSLKQRVIANASRILQLACSPVHNWCMEFLRRHPSSFVFDQLGGVEWVALQLATRKPLSSIDLKSASDNIPLMPQIRLVQKYVPSLSEPLRIFYEVSRMVYRTPTDITVKWTCGSPMGVKGSFGLFTIFLMFLIEKVGGAGKYAIVGDDIVVHSEYTKKVLTVLGRYDIPISKQKSLFDHYGIAEFCGKIILPDRALNAFKAPRLNLDKDPIGVLTQYGRRILRFLPGKIPYNYILSLQKVQALIENDELEVIVQLSKKELKDDRLEIGGFSRSQLSRLLPPSRVIEIPKIIGKDSRATPEQREQLFDLSSDVQRALNFFQEGNFEWIRRVYGAEAEQLSLQSILAWTVPLNDPDLINILISDPHFRGKRERVENGETIDMMFFQMSVVVSGISLGTVNPSASDLLQVEANDLLRRRKDSVFETRLKLQGSRIERRHVRKLVKFASHLKRFYNKNQSSLSSARKAVRRTKS